MINKISLFGLGTSKNINKKETSKNYTSLPLFDNSNPSNLATYSLNNLRANYMPVKAKREVSFGNKTIFNQGVQFRNEKGEVKTLLPAEPVSQVAVSYLPNRERIKGHYYDEFINDLGILIGSDNHVILSANEQLTLDPLVHNFATKTESNKFRGIGLSGQSAEIYLIKNPKEAISEIMTADFFKYLKEKEEEKGVLDKQDLSVKEFLSVKGQESPTILDVLADLSGQGSNKKVVFIQDFNFVVDEILNTNFENVRDCLDHVAPNLHVVGIMREKDLVSPGKLASAKAQEAQAIKLASLANLPKLELNGLSTLEAKEFLKKNPAYIRNVLDNYNEAYLTVSPSAIDYLVDKSAILLDGVLPQSALTALSQIGSAKLNESKSFRQYGEVNITINDAQKFFRDHTRLVDRLKPEKGRFKIAENVGTKLSDVGGISTIKEAIQEDILPYLNNPKQFIAQRGIAPKGMLFEGDPGNGKTLVARAIAGETNTPFLFASGSDFVEKYVGVGASRIRELFENARRVAENSMNKTAIIFIDEIDAFGQCRGSDSGGNSEASQTLNQLLTEMDGFDNKESKIKLLVFAATNRKDILDPALIRPGRFDDVLKIPNPDMIQDRVEILNIHAKKLKFESEAEKAYIIDSVAKITDGKSGADLASIMQKAQKIVSKRADDKFVTYNDAIEGFLQILAGPVKKTADERPFEDILCTVRHEGGHAVLMDFLKPLVDDKISFITLDNRGNFLGAVFHEPPKTNPDFVSVILSAAKSYAGGIAEPDFYVNGHDAGSRQDLSSITELFRKAITQWGLGVYTPSIALAPLDEKGKTAAQDDFYKTLYKIHETEVAKDIELFTVTARDKVAKKVIDFHADFLDRYVEMFKDNAGKGGNSLSGDEFSKLRQQWLVETGKVKQAQRLLRQISRILDAAHNSNRNIIVRAAKRMSGAIR